MKPLNGRSLLGDAVQANIQIAQLTRAVGELQGRLAASETMCRSLGQACEQLRQEASVLAGLHCIREGGSWEMTEAMIAQLPEGLEIALETTERGTRLYSIVIHPEVPADAQPAPPG